MYFTCDRTYLCFLSLVNAKGARKALADVSNIRRYPLRNRPSDGSRLK